MERKYCFLGGSLFRITLVALLLGCLWAGSAVAQQRQTEMPRVTTARPLSERVADYERAERDSWQEPDRVVQSLGLQPGQAVADIGSGTGYFSRRFSKAVGPNGKVYAVDIAQDILDYSRQEAEKLGLTNIVYVHSKPDDPMLPPNSVDLAFFADVTHHIANRSEFYRKLSVAIKPGGRIAIVDFPPDAPKHPHNPEQLVPRAEAIQEAEAAGFALKDEYKYLPRQYYLIFQKSDQSQPGGTAKSGVN